MSDVPRTAAATAAVQRHAAERALDNPAKLDRAVRVVRLALERGRLHIPDVLPPVEVRSCDGGRP